MRRQLRATAAMWHYAPLPSWRRVSSSAHGHTHHVNARPDQHEQQQQGHSVSGELSKRPRRRGAAPAAHCHNGVDAPRDDICHPSEPSTRAQPPEASAHPSQSLQSYRRGASAHAIIPRWYPDGAPTTVLSGPTRSGAQAEPRGEGTYAHVLRCSFMNPFTGKIAHVKSTAFRQLVALGFSLDAERPLQLQWRLADLEASCAAVRARRGGSREKGQQLASSTAMHAGPVLSASAATDPTRSANIIEGLATLLKPFQPPATRAACATGRTVAITKLLPPSSSKRTPRNWRLEVVEWFSRADFAMAIPTLLERRYDEQLNAYMPPKLDAVPDPAVNHVQLTLDQQNVLALAQRGHHLFIGGSAGTGKTVLLKVIFRELSQRGLRVAMTATTGVAAVQLGGCTFHSAFEVPVSSTIRGGRRAPRWDVNALRAVDVVIIDEVSLLNAHVLDAFDAEARLARLSTAPFGGIQVILCGDFLQLSHDAVAETLPVYLSAAFQSVVAVQLITPMRHSAGDPLLTLLEALRGGRFDSALFAQLDRPVPAEASSVTYIFPRRREAQALNDLKLCELRTEELVCTPQRGPLELLGRFTPSALVELPESMLTLPSPLTVLTMLQASLQEVVAQHGAGRAYVPIAEHDVVVMPCAAHHGTRLALVLRVRHGAVGGGAARRKTTRADDTVPAHTPATLTDISLVLMSAAAEGVTTALLQREPDLWVRACEGVARRLGGRVVQFYEQEPTSLVPLSVSRALADLTNSSDAAEALRPLRLKLGCRVMINRNLSRSVSNGSVGVVEAYLPPDVSLFPRRSDKSNLFLYHRLMARKPFARLPVVRLLSGEVVQIPPQARMLGGTAATFFYGHEVFSLPLQLGYGFTVHKVQGLTLGGTVVLDCERFFECPHLLYVACSRVRSIDQLIVHHVKPNMLIVKRSALEFSKSLLEAADARVLSPPPHLPRAAWTEFLKPRVFSMSE